MANVLTPTNILGVSTLFLQPHNNMEEPEYKQHDKEQEKIRKKEKKKRKEKANKLVYLKNYKEFKESLILNKNNHIKNIKELISLVKDLNDKSIILSKEKEKDIKQSFLDYLNYLNNSLINYSTNVRINNIISSYEAILNYGKYSLKPIDLALIEYLVKQSNDPIFYIELNKLLNNKRSYMYDNSTKKIIVELKNALDKEFHNNKNILDLI